MFFGIGNTRNNSRLMWRSALTLLDELSGINFHCRYIDCRSYVVFTNTGDVVTENPKECLVIEKWKNFHTTVALCFVFLTEIFSFRDGEMVRNSWHRSFSDASKKNPGKIDSYCSTWTLFFYKISKFFFIFI